MSAQKDDIQQLMNQARIILPGSSEAGLKIQLFDVFKEFFNQSSWWTENVNVTIVGDGVTVDYNVVPDGGQIVRLAGVVDANKFPQPAIMSQIGTITFAIPYTIAQTFVATLVKSVSKPTGKDMFPVVPDDVLPLFGLHILDGLLGKMMMQPASSFTDKQQAVYHLKRFNEGISRARTAALRRNTFGTQAWTYPQGFASRTQRGGTSAGNDTRFT